MGVKDAYEAELQMSLMYSMADLVRAGEAELLTDEQIAWFWNMAWELRADALALEEGRLHTPGIYWPPEGVSWTLANTKRLCDLAATAVACWFPQDRPRGRPRKAH